MSEFRPTATAVQFPNTHWTAILKLKDGHDTHTRNKAMRRLCEIYWFPLYAFARHRRLSTHDAEDAVQSFFVNVGDEDFFKKADQERGKLRTFILTAFTRMLLDARDKQFAQKRGGGQEHLSLDTTMAEGWLQGEPVAENTDPVLAFERHWALTIMRTAIAVLREEVQGSPKAAARFEILSRFLNPETGADYTPAMAAHDLGMTVSAVSRAIHRLRQHFRLAVRELVGSTLQTPDDVSIAEEMSQLQKALMTR